ncbi:MAG: UDP-N-acetylglucosamine 2-epimerase (hydrolyzing) [Deltaproteobacteria bacterium]|nr:UDP-N-acetylglucosamine 2-epimerase (hydrolyzing) [Deltaproteobacteria bacterium]
MVEEKTLLESCGGTIKALALSGIRSEYDLFYPLLKALNEDACFDLGVIAESAHLSPLHNYSFNQMKKDGFRIAEEIENLLYSNTESGKVKSAGILLQSLAQTFRREKPDLVLIIGDREDPIIGALAANYMNIPTVHIAGGDNTFPKGGDVDEQVRHATTKLSHVHLTMTEEHSRRVLKLGEESWRVFTVGSGGIDWIRMAGDLDLREVEEVLGVAVNNDYMIVLYNALSSEIDKAVDELSLCLEVAAETGLEVFVGAPNSDPGFHDIITLFKRYESLPKFHVYNYLPRRIFTRLLSHAKCILGNSSLAMHEAEFIGLPAVNVGQRQWGRLAGNQVQFVHADFESVMGAVNKALHDKEYKKSITRGKSIYGDGTMAKRSLEILKSLPSKEKLLAKRITY